MKSKYARWKALTSYRSAAPQVPCAAMPVDLKKQSKPGLCKQVVCLFGQRVGERECDFDEQHEDLEQRDRARNSAHNQGSGHRQAGD